MHQPLFITIDTSAIVHRAYHAFPDTLRSKDGLQTNAVYGFTSMLLSVIEKFQPKYIVAAKDTAKPTFRHTQYTDYKAHRKPTDQALIDQYPLVDEVLDAFNIPQLARDGFEADDIIGTLAERFQNGDWKYSGVKMLIVSGDKDLLQLVDTNVHLALPKGGFKNLVVYDREKTFKTFGFYPEQVVDFKAMVGDPSDNIPGIKGVGQKTAIELLAKYGSLDEIYKHLSELKPRQQMLFSEGVEQAEMSRELATVKRDVPIDVEMEDAVVKDFDRQKVIELFSRLSFRSLLGKIPTEELKAARVAAKLENSGQMSMFSRSNANDTGKGGTSSDDYLIGGVKVDRVKDLFKDRARSTQENSALLMYFDKDDKSVYLGLQQNESEDSRTMYWAKTAVDALSKSDVALLIKEGAKRGLRTHGWEDFVAAIDGSYATEIARNLSTVRVTDCALYAHVLSAGQTFVGLPDLAFRYLSIQLPGNIDGAEGQYLKAVDGICDSLVERTQSYVKEIHNMRTALQDQNPKQVQEEVSEQVGWDLLKKDVADRFLGDSKYEKYMSLEAASSIPLGRMERRGLLISKKRFAQLEKELTQRLDQITREAYESVGHEFAISSPKQVGELLFDELNLWGLVDGGAKKRRSRSTRAEILQELVGFHPVVEKILEYREISKLLSTYVTPYLDGPPEIHTDFLQTGTSSGRFSSRNPNLQNLPASGIGARVRSAFVARDGFNFVALDYSQIELRIFAHLSNDEAMIADFERGRDIHSAAAGKIFGKPPEKVTKRERQAGKTMNFAIVYGQTKYGLAKMLGVRLPEAEEIIEKYMSYYKGVKEYVERAKEQAMERGWVETMFGRRRYILSLDSLNRQRREAALREAINMPIQGSNADIMRFAMVAIDEMTLERFHQRAFPVLQIHDELVYEVQDDVAKPFAQAAEEIMKNIVKLKVPLEVHNSIGKDLAEVK